MAMVQQKIMEPIKQQLMQQKAEQDPEYAKSLTKCARKQKE